MVTARQKKMAVLLAKDVLKRLKKRYYKVLRENGYARFDRSKAWLDGKVNPGDDLQKALPKLKDCEICALGGLFLSYVALKDKVKVNRGGEISGIEVRDLLAKQIGRDQMGWGYDPSPIEQAFEDSTGSPRQKLRQIMRNIIRNKGVYKENVKK